MRPAFFLLAWVFFGLGVLGMALPGLPTVPFMLLALWAFSKSSKRFHHWLYTHRVFGPPLQQWETHRVIPWKAKAVSLTSMALSLAYMTFYTHMPDWLLFVAAAVMVYGAWFVLRHPSRPRA